MALSPVEIQRVKQLQGEGYSSDDIKEYIGASRTGRASSVDKELAERQAMNEQVSNNSRDWLDIAGAPGRFLAPGATEVFGAALARRGVGTDVSTDVTREWIEEPTARQYAGAALQTAGLAAEAGLIVASLGAAAPLTVGTNVALGAGLGYSYDVSEDLVAQESLKDTLTPGFGTVLGAGAPLVAAGLGAGYRAVNPATAGVNPVADDIGRAVAPTIREGISEGVEQGVETGVEQAVSGVGETGRGIANRITRSGRRVQETVEKNAERAAIRQGASPAVSNALDEGLDTNTILRIDTAPDASKSAYRAVVEAAEGANPPQAEKVSGSYATEMYNIARGRQREVGAQLGDARRALGTEPIDSRVSGKFYRTLQDTMRSNRINLRADGTVKFDTQKYTDEEQAVIQKIWTRMAANPNPSPIEVDEMTQFLSKMQYQTNVTDKLGSVYLDVIDPKTGTTQPVSIFNYMRNTYDSMLEQVDTTGEIARLRKEYATVKSVTDPIEGSWLNGLDLSKTTDEELADAMSLALRRLDGRAKSRTTYGQMYGALDEYARANGYKGADAADVSNFYMTVVEPLYSGTTPEASFRGGITGGIRSVFENVFDLGKADVTDKQRALRGLLEIPENTPATRTPAKVSPEVETSLQKLGESLTESSPSNVPEYLKNNKQGGFAALPINSTVTPEGVAKLMDDNVFDAFSVAIEDIETAKLNRSFNRVLNDMKLNRASNDELLRFLKESTDEYERLNTAV